MELNSVVFDEQEAMSDVLKRSAEFMEGENAVMMFHLNELFEKCFFELRDLSKEGFGDLKSCLHDYFDAVEKAAVFVCNKPDSFKDGFVDLVVEQILVLEQATVKTGSDDVFMVRVGLMEEEIVRDYVRGLIASDDDVEMFVEDTKVGDRVYQEGCIGPERQRGIQRQSLHNMLRGDVEDELPLFEAVADSFCPSAVDNVTEDIDGVTVGSLITGIRWRFAVVAGIAGVGCGVVGSVYVVDQSTQNGAGDEVLMVTEAVVHVDEAGSDDVVVEKERNTVCRVDMESKAYADYFLQIRDGSSVFVSNFERAARETRVSGWMEEEARKPLALSVLSRMNDGSDDKLTKQFSEVHYERVLDYSGGEWASGAGQTKMLYSAMVPKCELR